MNIAPKGTDRIWRYLRLLMTPRAVILGVAIVYLILMAVRVERWYQRFGKGRINYYPDHLLVGPITLTTAASLLLLRSWWSELIAILVSGWVLYGVYTGFRSVGLAQDLPTFSALSFRIWFTQMFSDQSQVFLEIALAMLIACYALVALSRRWLRRNARPKVRSSLT